ncbi:MAG: hypothetical protein ISS94_04150 [Candidatus Syntrophoarchaeum sp.]|nr:hypothetical protein [Candidatus Syntrophoarchaeum sp.]
MAKEVADKIILAARDASNEADFEFNTEHILKNVLDRLGITNYASYEFRTGKGTLLHAGLACRTRYFGSWIRWQLE